MPFLFCVFAYSAQNTRPSRRGAGCGASPSMEPTTQWPMPSHSPSTPRSLSSCLYPGARTPPGAVDPDTAQTQRVGGQHQVAHDEAAVVDTGGAALVCQHDEDRRGTIEGVFAFREAADLAVQGGEPVAQLSVGHGQNDRALSPSAVGGVKTGLDDLLKIFLCGGMSGLNCRMPGGSPWPE